MWCRQRGWALGDPWEWFAASKGLYAYRPRNTWGGVVRETARILLPLPVHPASRDGCFVVGGPSDYVDTCDYVALPLFAEEALRHVQYEEAPLRKLFAALADPVVRSAAGAAWSLGGRWALRDYLRSAGAIE